MLRLEVFVESVHDPSLPPPAASGPAPTRYLLLKLGGRPTVRLPLEPAQLTYAPAVDGSGGGGVRFEPLLVARAAGSWLLGSAADALGPAAAPGLQQPLHLIYAAGGGVASSGAAAAAPSVLGVGQLKLVVEDLRGQALPAAFPAPIQHRALQPSQLSCPCTGAVVGTASLAVRLSLVQAEPALAPSGTVLLSAAAAPASGTAPCSATITATLQCGGGPAAGAAAPATSAPASPPKASRRHAAAQASPAKPSAPAAAQAAAGHQQPSFGPVPLLACAPYLPPPLCAPMLCAVPGPPGYYLQPAWQAAGAPCFGAWPAGTAAPAASAPPPAVQAQPQLWCESAGQPSPPHPHPYPASPCRPPSRSAGVQTDGGSAVPAAPSLSPLRRPASARSFRDGERTPHQLCLNSPLKPQPTPLFLEHQLAEIRPSRSPARRHAEMVRSALRDSRSTFYCPGCLEPFMRLPHSPGRAAVRAAMEACPDCRHCSRALAAAAALEGVAEGAACRATGGDGHCPAVAAVRGETIAVRTASQHGTAGRPGSSPQGRQPVQRPGSRCGVSHAAPRGKHEPAAEVRMSSRGGAAAASDTSSAGSGGQQQQQQGAAALSQAEAAAFAQLLASLNLTSDWRERLLQSLAAPCSPSNPADGSDRGALPGHNTSTQQGAAAGPSRPNGCLLAAPAAALPSCEPQPAAAEPSSGGASSSSSSTNRLSRQGSSRSLGGASQGATPRRHWVPAGAAGPGARDSGAEPGARPPASGRLRRPEGTPEADGHCSTDQMMPRREAAERCQPQQLQVAQAQAQPFRGPAAPPHQAADTVQGIVARNQQLLALAKARQGETLERGSSDSGSSLVGAAWGGEWSQEEPCAAAAAGEAPAAGCMQAALEAPAAGCMQAALEAQHGSMVPSTACSPRSKDSSSTVAVLASNAAPATSKKDQQPAATASQSSGGGGSAAPGGGPGGAAEAAPLQTCQQLVPGVPQPAAPMLLASTAAGPAVEAQQALAGPAGEAQQESAEDILARLLCRREGSGVLSLGRSPSDSSIGAGSELEAVECSSPGAGSELAAERSWGGSTALGVRFGALPRLGIGAAAPAAAPAGTNWWSAPTGEAEQAAQPLHMLGVAGRLSEQYEDDFEAASEAE